MPVPDPPSWDLDKVRVLKRLRAQSPRDHLFRRASQELNCSSTFRPGLQESRQQKPPLPMPPSVSRKINRSPSQQPMSPSPLSQRLAKPVNQGPQAHRAPHPELSTVQPTFQSLNLHQNTHTSYKPPDRMHLEDTPTRNPSNYDHLIYEHGLPRPSTSQRHLGQLNHKVTRFQSAAGPSPIPEFMSKIHE